MRTVGCLSVLSILAFTCPALAQSAVPPPTGYSWPAATTAPAPAATPAPVATPAPAQPLAPAPAPPPAPVAAPVTPPGAPPGTAAPKAATPTVLASNASIANASAQANFASEPEKATSAMARPAPADEDAFYRDQREQSLTLGNSLSGGVGLLHLQTAFSGAPGTFRTSFISGYFSGSQFLCPTADACTIPSDTEATSDEAESISSDIAVSATLLPYLEGYVAMHSAANFNTFGRPKLLQVVGDTNFGVKLFSPVKPDRLFYFGGSLDLWLLNGSGMLGVDNADFTMRAMAGVDFGRRAESAKRIPIRVHTLLGYLVDGSGNLVEGVEASRGGNRISRIERFGLDINRVDSVLLGFGAEYDHRIVQPFIEWNFDIPNNRQGYACAAANNGRATGDTCLKLVSGFASTPSRLTLGTRISPGLRGLSGLIAVDIGTGGTSTFIEEVAPEVPWKLFFGFSYSHDVTSTAAPVVQERVVEKVVQLPPPPEYRVVGLVLDERTQQPVLNAIVRFQGQALTGMVTRPDGSFETTNLQPGMYSFAISAEGYREGQCQISVSPPGSTALGAMAVPPSTAGAQTPPVGPTNPAIAASAQGGPSITNVACPLKALPPVGTIQGSLIDAASNTPVPNARLTIRDAKGRELALEADGAGAFRFENVPAGAVRITAEADGYMPQNVELEVRARAEQRPTLQLNKRPKKSSVTVTAKEVKLTRQVNFSNDSATITQDSMGLVQEIAMTLREHPELIRIEIQGHTDNSGAPAYNKRLSQERAESVRNALVSLGIETARLTAVGYGQEKPLGPNSSDAAKAKNRRVQMMVIERR